MRHRFRAVIVLLFGAACSPQAEVAPAVPQNSYLIQLDRQPGRSDSLAAVAAGADSVTIIPLASAMVLKAAGDGASLRSLAGFQYLLVLVNTEQYGSVTMTFANPITPTEIGLLRSLSVGTYTIAFSADSISVVATIRYPSVNAFVSDSNAVAALIDPYFYFPI